MYVEREKGNMIRLIFRIRTFLNVSCYLYALKSRNSSQRLVIVNRLVFISLVELDEWISACERECV